MKSACFLVATLTLLSACNEAPSGRAKNLDEALKSASSSLPSAGAMVRAAARGDIDEMRKLQLEGASVEEDVGNFRDHITPLLAAIVMNQAEALDYLLRNGATCYHGFQGYTPVDFVNYFKSLPAYGPLYQALLDSGKCDL